MLRSKRNLKWKQTKFEFFFIETIFMCDTKIKNNIEIDSLFIALSSSHWSGYKVNENFT